MRTRLSGLYFFVVAVVLLLFAAGAVYILWLDYDALVKAVVLALHKNGLEEKIRNTLFTRQRFLMVQRMAWVIFLLVPVLCWLAIQYRLVVMRWTTIILQSVSESIQGVIKVYKNNSPRQNLSFFVFLLLIILFYTWRMIHSYATYDEMWSYNYYTSGRFYYSFFTYSSYPLFELSTHLFKWLPFSIMVNLRLSPFIFGIASCFLLYACLKKYFGNHFVALTGLAVFAFMPLTVMFMASARGVLHGLFFAIASLFSLLFWLNNPQKKKCLVVYCIAAVGGLYAMATQVLFLIFLFVAGSWSLMKNNKAALAFFIKINVVAVACFLILYTPMLLVTGIPVYKDVLANAPSFYQMGLRVPMAMRNILMDYVGRNYINLSLFVIAVPALLFVRNRFPKYLRVGLFVTALLPLSLLFFYFITRYDYAGRSLAFGSLSVPLFACFFAQSAITHQHMIKDGIKKILIAVGLGLFLSAGYLAIPARPIYKMMADLSALFMDNNIQTCYDNAAPASGFYYYYPGLEYYYRMDHKNIALILSAPNSMRFKPLLPADEYDCIVYDINAQDSSRVQNYHEIFRDPLGKFKIWKRNNLP